MILGFAFLLLGLLAMVASVHFKGLRYFDRPASARNPWFDEALDLLKWLLLVSGLALLLHASRPVFFGTAGILLLLEGYRRLIRSACFQERLLRREFIALKTRKPELPDEQILFELVYRKHPRWGPELIEQMVRDYPTVESLARILTGMERGFRGFSGKRPVSRAR